MAAMYPSALVWFMWGVNEMLGGATTMALAVPKVRLVAEVLVRILARMMVMETEVSSRRRGGQLVGVPAPSWPIWIGSGG